MCLPKTKFVELCEEFPSSAKILKYKAYLRRKQFRKAKLEVQAANGKKLLPQKSWKADFSKQFDVIQEKEEVNKILEEKDEDDTKVEEKSPEIKKEEQEVEKEAVQAEENQNAEVEGDQFLEHAKKLKVDSSCEIEV